MTDNTENIILEHLRVIRSDISSLKEGQSEIRADIISLKNQLHGFQGDFLRQEKILAAVRVDIDRIKNRLDLVDA